ncbi:hypothetical protein PENCOP_c004G04707 [Penicillium coprophilum]|uniref:Uncharacterized protein n=1 Tax=Penicillium coprophilum TaxID=36646 RepID=A0A1V6UUM0_9EURO|nr:hypothetical protein PENCOP_c004G04707 [Penicillium coprophilum]
MCDKKETEEIFSYMFRGHLNERGIQGFVPFATLNAQWVWMKNKQDPVWSHVHVNTAFETNGEWKEIITKIESVAKTLRFQLREKTEDDTNTSRWGSLVSEGEQSIASHEPAAPMLHHTLSTPETLNPMVLLCPTRDHVFGERPRTSQSIDEAMDHTATQTVCQQNYPYINIPITLHGSTEPVVTSDGKLCLWCDHEGTNYESEDVQELQYEDYDTDSGYEDTSHANQPLNQQEKPRMRESTQGFKRLMRELDGEGPYSDEELLDSEREEFEMTPQESPPELCPFGDPHLPMPLDLEQETLGSGPNSNWFADRSAANLAEFGTPSISMEDRSGALDDDPIPTQTTLSKFRFTQTRTDHDRALQYEWSSDDETRVENLRQISVEVLSQIENQSITHASRPEVDILMYDGNTWTQV